MAQITITNTALAKSDAETLATNAVETESVITSIEHILGELGQYWEESQQDAQTFAQGLKTNVETLKTIVECNKEFSTTIQGYAENQEKTAGNTVA